MTFSYKKTKEAEYCLVPLLGTHNDDNETDGKSGAKQSDKETASFSGKTTLQIDRLHESDDIPHHPVPEDERHCCQYNWIAVLLLSTVLSWFTWSAVMQIRQTYYRTNYNTTSDSGQFDDSPKSGRDPCFWTANFDGSWISRNRSILFANMSTQYEALYTFNGKNQKANQHAIPVTDCSANVLVGLTVARLRMRFDARQRNKPTVLFRPPHGISIPLEKSGSYLAHSNLAYFGTGLGNFMFILASLHGIARTNKRTFVLLATHKHEVPFLDLVTEHRTSHELFGTDNLGKVNSTWHEYGMWGKYDATVTNITKRFGTGSNVLFDGYLQAHQYFDRYREQIRSLFVMRKSVTEGAIAVLQASLEKFANTTFAKKLTTLPRLVGVHVRRGDIVKGVNHNYGHQPASEEYLLRTILHVQTEHEPVVFVVMSNDIPYCQRLFQEENFIFMDHHDLAEVDMAILSVMDYLILSVGTFGWWGAYLSDAREIHYYTGWPRNGSQMQIGINPADYFPQDWIPGS